ncbi:MAG: hypothetical protein M1355_04285 [Patescibacteria group bacterium]|nr:hypothetical protein [Patescibacteria group bacterium]
MSGEGISSMPPSPEDSNTEKDSELVFDHEKEKEHRKEIRKILVRKITESVKDIGLKKSGSSVWHSEVNNKWHILYLQRSTTSHLYYIEAGVCDVPIDKSRKPDIAWCGLKRKRIEYIVRDFDFAKEQLESEDPKINQEINDRIHYVYSLLDFEDPKRKSFEEIFNPSVSMEVAEEKIEEIGEIVKEYVPKWFQESEND